MEITPAQNNELPQIVSLLKESLGESLLPKSEAYFLWKHEQNPFGRSKILLAKDNGRIAGIRAFMRWSWVSKNQTITAVRAVDTATDPAYQGKGIFRKLTLQAAEECKSENTDMVFNTPNPKSRSGYLKMGWFDAGKMPIYLGPGSILPRLYSEPFIRNSYDVFNTGVAFSALAETWSRPSTSDNFHTPLTLSYLKWRYHECPIVKYGAIVDPDRFGLVFRIKKMNKFAELRICEIWTMQAGMDNHILTALSKLKKYYRPLLISCSPSATLDLLKNKLPGMFGPFQMGPITTLRTLAMDNLDNFDRFSGWKPSLGSMELF